MFPQSTDIVIIGGGVMGASTAYHLAARGHTNIVLLEKESFFGQGATGRCAGGVRYQFATDINIQLSLASLPMLERFPQELDQEVNYHPCGYLFMLTNEADLPNFQANMARQNKWGVPTQWLTGDEIRQRLPFMHLPDVLAGTFNQKDGLVDPNSVVMGYINAARRLGATVLTDAPVTAIELTTGRVTAVHTPHGRLATPLIINAAGPWAPQLGHMVNLNIPIQPIRRQILTTTPLPTIPADLPFIIDFSQSLYFHREGNGLLIGMSNPNQPPGYDQTVDEEWELINLDAAIERLPLLETAGLAAHWAGLYEVTPDAHPIFGPTPIPGFYLVGGFSGHGFMHGPIAGLLMSEIILDGAAHTIDVAHLDYNRFAENRLIQEYNVV